MTGKEKKKFKKGLEEHSKTLTPTQEQMLSSKHKYEMKMKVAEMTLEIHNKSLEIEKTKHKNILEEIKEMKKAGVKSLNR